MKIIRTSVGLMNILFDELDNLISGDTTPQIANAKVALAKTIISTKRLEIDHARFIGNAQKGKNGDVKQILLGE